MKEPFATILVTGHCGLIGKAVSRALGERGVVLRGLDLRGSGPQQGDIRDPAVLRKAMAGCDGVIHLAAVSRVIDGERDPETCWAVNAEATRHLVDLAQEQATPPWLIYASSREVYGDCDDLPAREDTPLRPVNIYGRSKAAAEEAVLASTLAAAIVRFSNVYGTTDDHVDRVVPAFCRQAAAGQKLRIDGSENTFDFTHLSDTVRGLEALVDSLIGGNPEALTAIHFLTGQPTTLGQLAAKAVRIAGSDSRIVEAPSRNFDVGRFYGDPAKAERLLGWRAQISLDEGLARLIADFRALAPQELASALPSSGQQTQPIARATVRA